MQRPQESSVEDEQDRWLQEATDNITKQAFFMKRALDKNNLKDALKSANAMLSEMRTSKLSPKNYYRAYISVADELRHLEAFFEEEHKKGRRMLELYETVQHAGNVLPRLYLLFTVGAVYIKSQEAPAKQILNDMVELARGVQHPMRGLFLRDYLSQISKDKLPDTGSEYEGAGGNVHDAINFVLENFGEMNKLWVRMQHQGAMRDRQRREQERQDLRMLVGTALVRISRLEGVDSDIYEETVLPKLLEHIANCKDVIAQEYLMDCIIQVFPDEFHIQTLETFLQACGQLQPNVKVKNIIISLMNRLSNFARNSPDLMARRSAQVDIFSLFSSHVQKIVSQGSSKQLTLADVLELHVGLVNFATNCYPDRIDYIRQLLDFCAENIKDAPADIATNGKLASQICKHIRALLTLPLLSLGLALLQLDSYLILMRTLPLSVQKSVAYEVAKAMVRKRQSLDTKDKLERLFEVINTLVYDSEDSAADSDDVPDEFEEQQNCVASLMHLIQSPDLDNLFQLYTFARNQFGKGGTRRIKHTLPPLVFRSLQLARSLGHYEQKQSEDASSDSSQSAPKITCKKIFYFVRTIVTAMAANYPALSFRLSLQCAHGASDCGFEPAAYEFMAQALIIYEDEIVSDHTAQYDAIRLIVGTLQYLRVFGQENYDTLITKTTHHSNRLLTKPEQCRAVYFCSHLFWVGEGAHEYHDGKRVLECLQRSLKIADTAMGSALQLQLFVEILNKYLYYFEHDIEAIQVKFLSGLLALIQDHSPNLESSPEADEAQTFFRNTLAYIMQRKQAPETQAKFAQIAAP